jgi:hypothetical protein
MSEIVLSGNWLARLSRGNRCLTGREARERAAKYSVSINKARRMSLTKNAKMRGKRRKFKRLEEALRGTMDSWIGSRFNYENGRLNKEANAQ